MTKSQIVLAIESAICGGSISLLRDGVEVANWIGKSDVSKAEDLLVNIDAMLTANDIDRQEINMIAVSAGPGSFTGIRIGIATALGMKAGLGIAMSSRSALKAMAFLQTKNKVTTAIPMGRKAVCLQSFQKQGKKIYVLDEPHTMPEDAFLSLLQNETNVTFVLHSALYYKTEQQGHIINFGDNIAYAIGLICCEYQGIVSEPIFVSKSF
ncbi:MAG: tRNA (adenosine(37)-N6)-threonylcarbamoyltransferase complex dimerization subunit type 1 TsaB [Chloracidobacterium sp.]|nr:tRNA (adenosine(37)-N6)-threonylcarbamoyltransferase complex dimerization subunit type 1 TsaB [Chloracidobacterium sp.]